MKPFVLTVAIVTTNPSCIKTNREVHPSHESIKNFPKQPKQFQQAYNKMDFAEPNNQQHQLAEHVSYYLEMDHLNSMGKLSTEGNEAGNRRFKTEKQDQGPKAPSAVLSISFNTVQAHMHCIYYREIRSKDFLVM